MKTFYDAEARVIDYTKGRGRHKGRVGALVVEMPSGDTFSIGTGLSDQQRENPPEIGSVVAYRYQELTTAGIPRFPSFIGERTDATGSDPPATGRKSTVKTTMKKQATKKKVTPTKAKKKAPTKQATATEAVTRMFLYDDESSSKFWEIRLDGCDVTVRYGKQGANGTTKVKSFDDESAAGKHAEKLIDQKTDKGYLEASE